MSAAVTLPARRCHERIATLDEFVASFGPLSLAERGFWARQLKMSRGYTLFRAGCPHRPKHK